MRLATSVLVLGITLLTPVGCGPVASPADVRIIAGFNAHRPEFGQLLEMFDHDGISGRLGCANTSEDVQGSPPLSAQRRAEYAKIFKTIGCDGAVEFSPGAKAEIRIPMWSVGMLWAGQDKSIAFYPGVPPAPIVETTDGHRWTQMDHQRGAVELYRHIDGPWYLEYVAN